MDKIRKNWAVMIALAAVSLLVVLNFSAILTWISEFIGMMFPLILGMILAFSGWGSHFNCAWGRRQLANVLPFALFHRAWD